MPFTDKLGRICLDILKGELHLLLICQSSVWPILRG